MTILPCSVVLLVCSSGLRGCGGNAALPAMTYVRCCCHLEVPFCFYLFRQ